MVYAVERLTWEQVLVGTAAALGALMGAPHGALMILFGMVLLGALVYAACFAAGYALGLYGRPRPVASALAGAYRVRLSPLGYEYLLVVPSGLEHDRLFLYPTQAEEIGRRYGIERLSPFTPEYFELLRTLRERARDEVAEEMRSMALSSKFSASTTHD